MWALIRGLLDRFATVHEPLLAKPSADADLAVSITGVGVRGLPTITRLPSMMKNLRARKEKNTGKSISNWEYPNKDYQA